MYHYFIHSGRADISDIVRELNNNATLYTYYRTNAKYLFRYYALSYKYIDPYNELDRTFYNKEITIFEVNFNSI